MTKTPSAAASHKIGMGVAVGTQQSVGKSDIAMIAFRCLTFQPKENKLIQDPIQVLQFSHQLKTIRYEE